MKQTISTFALVLLLVSHASAQGGHEIQDLERWMAYYYLNPQPDNVALALQTIKSKGFFENNDVQAPLSGFFSEVFSAHPEKINTWIEPYIGIPKRHILYSALWTSNTTQSRAALERMAKAVSPEEAKQIRSLLASSPPTVDSMLINSPAALDYLWGRFMASGSVAPVNRIIDQMKLVNSKGNIEAMLIGGAAQWSVSANARQHKKVLEIVKARAGAADPQTKKLLNEILAGIDAEKAKKAR